jgi:hypothetical protein
MRGNKDFSNTTFTKRVDRESGRHHAPRSMPEPGVCQQCGSIYKNRRWTAGNHVRITEGKSRVVICPACKQENTGNVRGFVFLDGSFFVGHQNEIEKLLRNETERAAEDNVLSRILEWRRGDGHKLTLTTTTEHLAQRLGHALEKTFGGEVRYDFSHENKLARVSWKRGN